ncbi:ABC transporter ATP-binding protein [Parachitinimonas caeni]|uniref:ABC transporter transmembrane domain-containing protein n=1 Tax=Parachitinimonas caeni TaxID=3031301 RepID=A0ABT7DXF8_9NEIS|nr:ABC transporter transmembrane domain-containing protein [Parachitinimonas caeni]MDK2124721.1 ABC transporter transmembrane domain-containing protein [Parachitinimonas caeni]
MTHPSPPNDKRQAIQLLSRAAAPESRHLWLGLAWLLVAAGLEALGPVLSRHFIDDHLLPRQLDWPSLILLLGGGLVTGWIATGLRYLQLVRLAGVAMRSVRRLRAEVYDHVLRLPMAFFDKAITGQLVSRVTNDTEAVKALYVQVLFILLDSCIVLLGALGAMAWLDLRLMLIVSVLVPAVVVIVWFYQRWSGPAVARARELRSDINAQISESIAGMNVLQAANAEGRFSQRFLDTNQAHYTARMAELRANAWLLRPALDLLNVTLLAIVIFVFGLRELSGMEVGILYAFVSYMGRVVEPLIQITMQFSMLQQSVAAAARVNALLQETTADAAQGQARIGNGAVQICDLSFGYSPETPVIHDLSLQIPAGSFYGVVGHTGSGKSTLLSLLLRFYTAQSGRIEIDGVALNEIAEETFRSQIGLVPQDPFLLAASARENIDMGRGLSDIEIETAAKAARCHDFILALEQGYATPLGEGGAKLSVGQKQLLAIARALAGKPRILFLDEATAHIDSETEQIVQQALNALRGNVTLIAIAHRLSTIRDADRIIVLNHGRIAEEGNHEGLMAIDRGIYQRLYLLQQLGD